MCSIYSQARGTDASQTITPTRTLINVDEKRLISPQNRHRNPQLRERVRVADILTNSAHSGYIETDAESS